MLSLCPLCKRNQSIVQGLSIRNFRVRVIICQLPEYEKQRATRNSIPRRTIDLVAVLSGVLPERCTLKVLEISAWRSLSA